MSDEEKPVPLLADVAEEGVDYIKPNIEIKLPANKRLECREIVNEVREFGITQRQVLYLIYLLALELEDREIMLTLTKAIGENRDNVAISNLIIPE